MPSSDSTVAPILKRGPIRRILEPALQLWLRSQVESVSSLEVHLEGGDRQILSGHLPNVRLKTQKVVYQGLHLSQIELNGSNLRINIGQILKGKSLRLLEPLPIDLSVSLLAPDARASLHSALFQSAIIDALLMLVGEQITEALGQSVPSELLVLQDPYLHLSDNTVRFSALLSVRQGERSVPVALKTSLRLEGPHTLSLDRPEWLPTPQSKRGLPLRDLQGYSFDLGPQVQLQELAIAPEGIFVRGRMTVLPEI
ncbi:DUF2993 domain-containing protein [Altericista sp. CCNU0014]|uniref:LmeA family phospholipid-binding protein n=1 Tax=Altericista sp. CCNU0014 TaxID=3082949 RepID=UPI00384AA40E